MKLALFYHSLLSDWNHGNAHFLRGVATELLERGHEVQIYEPANGWSLSEMRREKRADAEEGFSRVYPRLQTRFYEENDWEKTLGQPDLIIAHEWNSHDLIARLGKYRATHPAVRLLFHDTHHRAVTAPDEMSAYDLTNYDGVLAYGEVLRELYREKKWARAAWTWHEAADVRVFYPRPEIVRNRDLVWIGNWGDGERTETLREHLLHPVKELGLDAQIHGVRYSIEALEELKAAGIAYGGWLPNFLAPETFARFRVTVHVPRGPYVNQLRGIPTIRPFEAMACGIPLISAPWDDVEELFRKDVDYLAVGNGRQMREALQIVLHEKGVAEELARNGLETILGRHTCGHRVDELLGIFQRLL